ncbi:hypothetical protein E2C01_076500 [Portunus trituberculatus]|uniref:Uncharacterized protein n=1 Tax=Portunus trituberculatus TaxID=210409 RepID=A0A5B7IDD0_PORTR|nr:hypothetical protein [Portunus trituberculatus]
MNSYINMSSLKSLWRGLYPEAAKILHSRGW